MVIILLCRLGVGIFCAGVRCLCYGAGCGGGGGGGGGGGEKCVC